MTTEEDFQKQLMATFQAELEEHLNILSDGVLTLEKNPGAKPSRDLLQEMFRAAHSLKGAARAVELSDLETISHKLEDTLGAFKKGVIEPSSELADLLLASLDLLRKAMEAHMSGQPLRMSDYQPLLVQLGKAALGEKPDIDVVQQLASDTPASQQQQRSTPQESRGGPSEAAAPKTSDLPPKPSAPPAVSEQIPPSSPSPVDDEKPPRQAEAHKAGREGRHHPG